MSQEEQAAVELIARKTAEHALREHLTLCPFASLAIEQRLRAVETRFAALLGAVVGSGVLGGSVGALLSALFGS